MKKIHLLFLLVAVFSLSFSLKAQAACTAGLTGPGTVRAGDTITLTFNAGGSGMEGATGTLSYDGGQVTLVGIQQLIGSPWAVEVNGNSIVAYDNELTRPLDAQTGIFSATFRVSGSLATGTALTVSVVDTTLSDGSSDNKLGTVSYSAVIAAPLSTDCTLGSLTVSNADISPAFSAGTTEYSASVPFEVAQLAVNAQANDGRARVSVNSPALTVNGMTDVVITVVAENGASRNYVIHVMRAQDPNYKPSTEARLASLAVENFFLSPAFDPDKTSYVLWLPYETTDISVKASNLDGKGSLRIEGGNNLAVGDNTVKVIGVAEDGITEAVYTIVVRRAENPEEPVTEPETTEEPTTEEETVPTEEASTEEVTEASTEEVTTEASTEPETEAEEQEEGVVLNLLAILVTGALCLAIGFLVGKAFS